MSISFFCLPFNCVFLSLDPSYLSFLRKGLYGVTMVKEWRAGECCFVGEVPRGVFVIIVRCSHWKPHSSTSGCLTEGPVAGQLTVRWCSKASAVGNGLAGEIIPACPVCVTAFLTAVWVTENAHVFIPSGIFYIFQIWNLFYLRDCFKHRVRNPNFISALRKILKSCRILNI